MCGAARFAVSMDTRLLASTTRKVLDGAKMYVPWPVLVKSYADETAGKGLTLTIIPSI